MEKMEFKLLKHILIYIKLIKYVKLYFSGI